MSSTRGSSGAFHTFHDRIPSTSFYRHDSHRWTSRDLKDALEGSDLASPDQPVPSIEPSDPSHDREFSNETILRIDDRADQHASSRFSSPRKASHLSQSSAISEFPDYDIANTEDAHHALFTPIKDRPVFRNPSSVRAMQMASPPPFDHFSSPRSAQRYKLSTPSRSGTPRSARSQSAMKAKGASPKPPRKEHPLVLLHVTLLPVVLPYSLESMQAILSPAILENYNLLRDKASDTVLQRGILIPHPGEDYELLEERLLEALELKTPRILKCGHFHLSCSRPSGTGKHSATFQSEHEDAGSSSSHSRHSSSSHCSPSSDDEGGDIDPAERCTDCGRRIKEPRFGLGEGNRRYEVRIYASNGLMRAGAWAAAWKEMERVDVEIGVWMPEGMRREMDEWRAKEEDEIRKAMVEEEVQRVRVADVDTGVGKAGDYAGRLSPEPRLGKNARAMGKELDEGVEEAKRIFEIHMEHEKKHSSPRRRPETQVPLTTLLQNYVYLLAQDRWNIAIFVLTVSLLFLAFRPTVGGSLFPKSSVSPAMVDSRLIQDALLPDVDMQLPNTESITQTQIVYHTQTLTVSQTAPPSSPAATELTAPTLATAMAADTQEEEESVSTPPPSASTSPSDADVSSTEEGENASRNGETELMGTSLPQPSALMAAVMPDAFPESRAEET